MRTLNETKMFELLFEHASIGIAIIEASGRFIAVNKKLCDIAGYTEDEFLTGAVGEKIDQSLIMEEVGKLQPILNNEQESIKYKIKYKNKFGEKKIFAVQAIAIHENGEEEPPTHILKCLEELSTVVELKKEVDKNKFIIDKIMKEMPLSVYFKNLDSQFTLANNVQAERYNAKSNKDLIGKSDFDFLSKEDASEMFAVEQEVIKTGKDSIKLEKHVNSGGSITWVQSVQKRLLDENNEVIGVFGISTDVTESKNAEHEIAEAHNEVSRKNKELKITLQGLKDAQSGLVNSEKLAALGQLVAGIAHEINTPLGAINASNSNIQNSCEKLMENARVPFTLEESALLNTILNSFDGNRDSRLSSREKRKLKKEIVDRFLKNGCLNAARVTDHIIYMNIYDKVDFIVDSIHSVDVLKVLENAKILLSLIKNNMNIELATSKASNVVLALKKYLHNTPDGELTPIDIEDSIETVLTLNSNVIKRGINIVKDYDKIPLINGLPDEITQVWNNLITNGIHAMHNQGDLVISIKKMEQCVHVIFTDTGYGIPDDIKEKIFKPFFTTKVSGEGTGLGLDIVKRIVDKHNGSISLESEVNKGTSFTVMLPL